MISYCFLLEDEIAIELHFPILNHIVQNSQKLVFISTLTINNRKFNIALTSVNL